MNKKITKAFKSACNALDLKDKEMHVDPWLHSPYLLFYLQFKILKNKTGKYEIFYFKLSTLRLNNRMIIIESIPWLKKWIKNRILNTIERNNPTIKNKLISTYNHLNYSWK